MSVHCIQPNKYKCGFQHTCSDNYSWGTHLSGTVPSVGPHSWAVDSPSWAPLQESLLAPRQEDVLEKNVPMWCSASPRSHLLVHRQALPPHGVPNLIHLPAFTTCTCVFMGSRPSDPSYQLEASVEGKPKEQEGETPLIPCSVVHAGTRC